MPGNSGSVSFYTNEVFYLNISSSNIFQVEVSVNSNANFQALSTTNGQQMWPANFFKAGIYNLMFRGKTASGSFVNCKPGITTIEVKALPVASDPVAINPASRCAVQLASTSFSKQSSWWVLSSSSNDIASVQVSVNTQNDFVNLKGPNERQDWPGNFFQPGSYTLFFRGLKADGTNVRCSPSFQTILVTE